MVREDSDDRDIELIHWGRNECRFIHNFQCPDDNTAVIHDAKRLESYGCSWEFIGLVVTASIDGHEFGRASLWGIENDSSNDFIDSTIEELTQEAIEQAESELAKFCTKHCQALV